MLISGAYTYYAITKGFREYLVSQTYQVIIYNAHFHSPPTITTHSEEDSQDTINLLVKADDANKLETKDPSNPG